MIFAVQRARSRVALLQAGALIALIALGDWSIQASVPLGFLYLFPMLLVGSAAGRIPIALVAALCTALSEAYDAFEWSAGSGIPRDILYFAAFFCMGLFVFEVTRSRKIAAEHLEQIEHQSKARLDAEEQLKVLVESSPAAIFTTDAHGTVLLANDAAHRLLGVENGFLAGRAIAEYLPSIANVPPHGENGQVFRTVMQSRGRRENGEAFLADVWFSTYRTSAGVRLAAMVVDTSEDLRTREEFSLQQLLQGSRILVGAVSHEVRNVCSAVAVVYQNLARTGELANSKDFDALRTLVTALEKIAAIELRQTVDQAAGIYLPSLLEELRIVVEVSLKDAGIASEWQVDPNLPPVWADRQSLLQVFLNLVKNAERALANRPIRHLVVVAEQSGTSVEVRFRDTGGGVIHPDQLFRPFQSNAQATGLGLFLSRGFMRSFRGDLLYEAEEDGSTFVVKLMVSSSGELTDAGQTGYSDLTNRRSRIVPGEPKPASRG